MYSFLFFPTSFKKKMIMLFFLNNAGPRNWLLHLRAKEKYNISLIC